MDATRSRRTRDCARQRWYAAWRCQRFARHLGFAPLVTAMPDRLERSAELRIDDAISATSEPEFACSWELLLCAY